MKCFFVVNEESPNFDNYFQMMKVAIHTLNKNTSLEPFCIYDGEKNKFTEWLETEGILYFHHRTPLYERLESEFGEKYIDGKGAFLKLEIPKIVEINGFSDEYVLYSDCDVIFLNDVVEYLTDIRCGYLAAAPEHDPNNWSYLNSGVMYLNIRNLQKVHEQFYDVIEKNLKRVILFAYDQGAYNLFFSGKWDRLDLAMNWKPYWQINPMAKIIHFHGPKPTKHHVTALKNSESHILPILHFANENYWKNVELWEYYNKELHLVENGLLTPKRLSLSPHQEDSRHTRRNLAESWLKVPPEFLEKAYSGDMGNAHRRLMESGVRNEALSNEETVFFQHLNSELTRRSSVDPVSALNYLLAIMLYLPSGRLKIENARASLPGWLIGDYERFFGV